MKRLIISCFLIATVISAYSQKHIRLSFVGDPSVNWMRTSNSITENGKSTLGYDFGLNGDFYFSEDERYSFSTGIQISNTGGNLLYHTNSSFQFSGSTLPALTKIKYQIRYIEVPLNVKLRTDQFNGVKYWGLLGFSTMVNIASNGISNDGTLKKADINDEVNLFNLAMNIGIGFDFELNESNSITTGLIFQNGLIDITTDNAFSDKTIINSLKLKIGLIF
jgi:hypothetical protein